MGFFVSLLLHKCCCLITGCNCIDSSSCQVSRATSGMQRLAGDSQFQRSRLLEEAPEPSSSWLQPKQCLHRMLTLCDVLFFPNELQANEL